MESDREVVACNDDKPEQENENIHLTANDYPLLAVSRTIDADGRTF